MERLEIVFAPAGFVIGSLAGGNPSVMQRETRGGFADRLGSITAPTLVVASDDPFLPPDFLRAKIVAPIARARLVIVPGAGHYPQVERTRETAAVLGAFLAGLGA